MRARQAASLLFGVGLVAAAGAAALGGNIVPSGNDVRDDRGGFRCTVASITDGDTLRCVEQGADGRPIRVRIAGIAARERDGSCSPGHPCPAASAEAATAALDRLASGQSLHCQANGLSYGRVAAFCEVGGLDLSCAMVASGTVELWPRYWRDHRC